MTSHKPIVLGKTINLREIGIDDAEFVLALRTNANLGKHLSRTAPGLEQQRNFIRAYQQKNDEFYFVIVSKSGAPLGTVRIYDPCDDSFCWGSWIIQDGAPHVTAIESALLVYDFAFYALHYRKSHFDVRLGNTRVIEFHKRFGAEVIRQDEINCYFVYDRQRYLSARAKYSRYLP